jgi:hypothetical protein
MDDHELSRRAKALPDRFDGRGNPDWLNFAKSALQAGEWAEGLEILSAGLANDRVPITSDERDELAALFDAIGEPAVSLDTLRVQD